MARSIYRLSLVLAAGAFVSSCSLLPKAPEITNDSASQSAAIAPADVPTEPVADTTTVATTPPEPSPYFGEGVTRAESAVAIGQSAQSPDDWTLAASRWKQAVSYMQQVPSDDPNYSVAQQKVKEYQQNLGQAEKRAAGEVPTASATVKPDRPPGLVASIPVINQMGGTPVVPVTLTGNKGTQQFTMLFDTGASGTLITAAMADAIGVVITGTALVTVADGRQVEIPVGYVDTLQVGDLVVRDLWVAVGGDVGLLGQDVYGEYGLSIGANKIDLYK